MLKRLAARGKTPPPYVSTAAANSNNTNNNTLNINTNTPESLDIAQNAEDETPASPVSPSNMFLVTVYPLDDEQKPIDINVQRDSDGQWLFDEACEQLGGLQEKDYFGLRYLDRDKQRQWVDPSRNIYRQLKHIHPCCVSFRVKHYPPQPLDELKQEISKYFLYLQIKRDILHSRLLCQGSEAYELAAYIAQADLGDYDDIEDPELYLSEFKVLPNQSPKSETKIAEIHKTLHGILPNEAEAEFLSLACKMETYGIDPYSVKDQKGNVLYLGLTHLGVVTFQGSRRAHIFKWADITKFNYDGKLFIIHVTFREDNQFKRKSWLDRITKKHILGFKCDSRAAALSLWRWAVDRYCFFTLKRSSEAKRSKSGGGLFRRSHTFRFSGRCQKEVLTSSLSLLTLPQPSFTRTSSLRKEERLRPENSDDKFATFPRTHRQAEGPVLTAHSATDGTHSTLDDRDPSPLPHALPSVVVTGADALTEASIESRLFGPKMSEREAEEGGGEEDEKTVVEADGVPPLDGAESDSGVEGLAADTETSSCTLGKGEACILDDDSDDCFGRAELEQRTNGPLVEVVGASARGLLRAEDCTHGDGLAPDGPLAAEEDVLMEEETERELALNGGEKDREMVAEGEIPSGAVEPEKTETLAEITDEIFAEDGGPCGGEGEERKKPSHEISDLWKRQDNENAKADRFLVQLESCSRKLEGEKQTVWMETEDRGLEDENERVVKENGDVSEEIMEAEREKDLETEKVSRTQRQEASGDTREARDGTEASTERSEETETEIEGTEASTERNEETEKDGEGTERSTEKNQETEKDGEGTERSTEKNQETEKERRHTEASTEKDGDSTETSTEKIESTEASTEKEIEGTEASTEKIESTEASTEKEIEGTEASTGKEIEGTEASTEKEIEGIEASTEKEIEGTEASTEKAIEGTEASAERKEEVGEHLVERSQPSAAPITEPAGPRADLPEDRVNDGGIVETIIVPAMASKANRANGPAERGVDVGDGGSYSSKMEEPGASSPVQAGEPSSPSSQFAEGMDYLASDMSRTASPPLLTPASKRSVWRRCLTSVVALLFVSGATLLLLFEFGPSWSGTKSLLNSGPAGFLEDWRQQWYLPLRGRVLPAPK